MLPNEQAGGQASAELANCIRGSRFPYPAETPSFWFKVYEKINGIWNLSSDQGLAWSATLYFHFARNISGNLGTFIITNASCLKQLRLSEVCGLSDVLPQVRTVWFAVLAENFNA